jgi:hypothetical protein
MDTNTRLCLASRDGKKTGEDPGGRSDLSVMFSPGTPVSTTNQTDRNDISEILLNVALNLVHLEI